MRVAVRVDSSSEIGSGHVMRCLTLAEGLRRCCAKVIFVCRNHSGNLNSLIQQKGFSVLLLPEDSRRERQLLSGYMQWLGVEQKKDAEQTLSVLKDYSPDMLIVDHYGVSVQWERVVMSHIGNLFVIDDLINKQHDCSWLLDQNFRQQYSGYNLLNNSGTVQLLGPKYALLRPDFLEFRNYNQRSLGSIRRLFVFFGGVDSGNLTVRVINVLRDRVFNDLFIDIVIGVGNPHKDEVKGIVSLNANMCLHVQVDNMAELMSKADLSIGAGGATTWERMVLGLPSVVITVADNQVGTISDLHDKGYIVWLGDDKTVTDNRIYSLLNDILDNPEVVYSKADAGMDLVDGLGVQRLVEMLCGSAEA